MESGSPKDMNRLISELTQGKELTRQLESQIEQSSPPEQCKHLVQSLLSTWDKAISMARSSSESDGERRGAGGAPWGDGGPDSPRSLSGSPPSGSPDRALKDQESREMCKKRKTLPQWTRRVNVSSETGMEGPLDDGYSWRKYGQKDILGARYPRGYYRCTHRPSQGCPATKLVQRSDQNPAVFDVIYRGYHTCVQRANSAPAVSTAAEAAAEQEQRWQQQQEVRAQLELSTQLENVPVFRTALTVKTEDLDRGVLFPSPSCFSFPSTPVGWVSPVAAPLDSPFTGSFSPSFISPREASGSSCLPTPPCQVGDLGGGQWPPAPEPDLADVFYGASSSGAYSATVGIEFMLDPLESDPNLTFDPSLFP